MNRAVHETSPSTCNTRARLHMLGDNEDGAASSATADTAPDATKKLKPLYIFRKGGGMRVAAMRFFDGVPGALVDTYLADVGVRGPKTRAYVVANGRLTPLHECAATEWVQHPIVLVAGAINLPRAKQIVARVRDTPAVMSLDAQELARGAFDDWRDARPEFDAREYVEPISASDARSYTTRLGASSITSTPHVRFGVIPREDVRPFNKRACAKAVSGSAPFQLARARTDAIAATRTACEATDDTRAPFPSTQNVSWLETQNVRCVDGRSGEQWLGMWARVKLTQQHALFEALATANLQCVLPVVQVFPAQQAWIARFDMPCETLYARAARGAGMLTATDAVALHTCVHRLLSARLYPATNSLRDFAISWRDEVYINPTAVSRHMHFSTASGFLTHTAWQDFPLVQTMLRLHMASSGL